MTDIIEDMKLADDFTTKGIQRRWIQDAPNVLFFSLSRVQYDTKA